MYRCGGAQARRDEEVTKRFCESVKVMPSQPVCSDQSASTTTISGLGDTSLPTAP